MFNTDLWFHLAAGRLIVEQRGIPRVDSWSFAAPRLSWQNHEWLADVLLHLWERALGTESLTYWMWGTLLATFLLLFAVLRRLSGNDAFSFLATSLCAALSSPFFEIRPNLLTQLLFAAVIPLTLVRRRPWWGLPLLVALWINLHGGGVFGLMAIGVALAARAVERKPASPGDAPPPRPMALLGLFGACVAAALANPFGLQAVIFPLWLSLFSHSMSRRFLGEWQSPWVEGGIRAPLFPLCIALAVLALPVLAGRLRHREGLTLGLAGLTALTLFMSLQSRRFIPLFAIALGPWLAHAWEALRTNRSMVGRRPRAAARNLRLAMRWGYAAALLALAAGCLRLSLYPIEPQVFNSLVKLDWMPVESLNFIEANSIAGNVFADFEWAGYVQYRTAGRMKVFADPRWETVYPESIQMRYLRVLARQGDWRQIIEGSGAQYVLWPPNEHDGRAVLDGLVRTGRWRRLYEDRRSVLLVRTDIPQGTWQPTQPSSFRTWALAHRAQEAEHLAAAEQWLLAAREQQPVLVEVCRDLAVLQARRGDEASTRATAGRCDRIFPDSEWRARLESYLVSRSSAELRMPTGPMGPQTGHVMPVASPPRASSAVRK